MAIAQAAVVFQWLSLGAFAAILIVAGGLLWRRPEVRLLLVFPAAWAVSGALSLHRPVHRRLAGRNGIYMERGASVCRRYYDSGRVVSRYA